MKRIFPSQSALLLLALPLTLAAGCGGDGASTSGSGSSSGSGSTSGSGGEGGSGGGSTSGSGGAGGMGGGGGAGGSSVCTPGSTDFCYSGPAGTEVVGLCKAGVQTCLEDGSGYGPCVGEVVPVPESCLTMGDDDCDGAVNEEGPDCVCVPNTAIACYSGPMDTKDVGDCKAGTQTCNAQGTAYGPCVGEVVPGPETCATPGDEDCDGQINEEGSLCVCIPNATMPCYAGPMGTEGVGICLAGAQTCNATGTAWGACVGAVLPQTENCATPADESCTGVAGDVCGAATWTKRYGDTLDQDAWDVATDPAGNIVVVGQFAGMVDFGGGPLTTPNSQVDVFVAKFDANGNHLWSKRYGANGQDSARSVAVDTNGDVYVTGVYQSTVDFGGGPFVSSMGTTDVFVLKLSAAGDHVWSKTYGSTGGDEGSAIAVDGMGNVVVVGHYRNTVDFGGGAVTSAGLDDAFVLKLSSGGVYVWSKSYGDAFSQNMRDVAVGPANEIVFGGFFESTVDYGGGPLIANGTSDGVIVKLTSAGAHVFSKAVSATGSQVTNGVAVDGAGNVIAVGNAAGAIDFGGGLLANGGMNDAFIVKYNAMGAYLFSDLVGDGGEQLALGVAVDKQSNFLVVGRNAGTADFGGGPLSSPGLNDVFVVKYTPAGAHLWSRRAGDALEQWARAITVDGMNAPIVVGRFQGTMDLGSGPVTSVAGYDAFMAKLSP